MLMLPTIYYAVFTVQVTVPQESLQEEEVAQGKMFWFYCKVLLYVKACGFICAGGSRWFALRGCEVTHADNSILY